MLKTQEVQKQQFISIEKTNALKGLFAITVLLHHIGQNTAFSDGTFLESILNSLGYLSVSVFLFLSGYGLSVSYLSKGENYLKTFPKAKLLPFYIQNLILIAIYMVFWCIIGEKLSAKRIILSFFFGHTVIKYGWYIQATLVFYVLFYFAFKTKTKASKITVFVLGYTVYFSWCLINHLWSMWYISVLAFAVGIIYAHINSDNKYITVISGVIFAVFYILANFGLFGSNFSKIFKMVLSIVFPILILSIFKLLPFKFYILKYISKISFEIYVLQGLFLTLFHSNLIYIKNKFLYIVLVVISTIAFSIVLNKLFKFILQKKEKKYA